MTTPVAALAQENCPPGSWFCEQAEVSAPPEAEALPEAAPAPAKPKTSTQPAPGQPPVVVYQPSPSGAQSQIIIVTPAGEPAPRVVVRTAPAVPPAPPPPPPPPKSRWRPEWGINLRLEGVALGRNNGAADDAGMGGLGFSVRYRPVPAFALDVGIDVLGGTDYNGYERTEIPLSLNGVLFVNPRSRVQFYFMGGLHVSHAEVDVLPAAAEEEGLDPVETQYDYFGGQGGVGLEFRISRRIALNIDALGFVRSRTDDEGMAPEFVDPETGRTTDTSGGGLFRGGISFYW